MSCLKWFTKRDDRKQAGCHFEIQYRRLWFWKKFFLGTEMVHQHSIVLTTNPPIRMLDQWNYMYRSRLRWFTKWDSRKQAGCHVTIQYHRQWFWHEFFLGTEMVHQHSIISTTNPTVSMPGQWKRVYMSRLRWFTKWDGQKLAGCRFAIQYPRLWFWHEVHEDSIISTTNPPVWTIEQWKRMYMSRLRWFAVWNSLKQVGCRLAFQNPRPWFSVWIFYDTEKPISWSIDCCFSFLKCLYHLCYQYGSKEYALICKSQLMAITALQITSLSSASSRWSAWNATKWKESG
jgi:hypothetical protein